MKSWLKYSNGWGHLIMSLATMIVGIILVIIGQSIPGTSIISIVVAAWFIPGAANQVATKVIEATKTAPTGQTETTEAPRGQTGDK